MNSQTANKIPIKDIVETISGISNGKIKGSDVWYKSPFREEKTESFVINTVKNNWIDFGRNQKVASPVDFVMEYRNCTVSEALSIIEDTGLGYKSTYIAPTKQDKKALFPPTGQITKQEVKENIKKQKAKEKADQLLKYYQDEHQEQLSNATQISSKSFNDKKAPYIQDREEKQFIRKIQPLKNIALLDYLSTRKIDLKVAESYCNELYFHNISNGKNYFAISFTNDSGAYEWRHKYSKGILGGKKDITSIYLDSAYQDDTNTKECVYPNTVRVFEGFMDFLSYLSHQKLINPSKNIQELLNHSDYIVLNSVALVDRFLSNINTFKAIDDTIVYGYTHKDDLDAKSDKIPNTSISEYQVIELYLDNDQAGDIATEKIQEYYYKNKVSNNIKILDKRFLYGGFNDYNDYLIALV